MAEAATQDFVSAAVGGAGNRADVAGVTGRPGVAEDSKARVAEGALTDAATTAASCTSVGSKAGRGDLEDKNDGGTRGSGRKFSRLRSAAFFLANGVTRMHSQLRPATAGSAAATSGKALPVSAECGGASAAASPPISPTTLRMAGPSCSSSCASSAATAVHLSEHASAGGRSVLSSSRNNTAQLPSNSSAVDADQSSYRVLAKVDESNEAEAQQQQVGVSGGALPPTVNVNAVAQETAAGDAEVHEEPHPAAENASPATTATRASVMSTDLGGFYRKLLGEDWEEQLKELNEESNRLLDTEDADVAAGAAAPPGLGGAAAQGDELQLPDTYQGKMRQRIRRRDVSDRPRDISDQVADDLHFGQDEEPLITPEDIAVIREQAWIPAGEGLPQISEMELGYHRAWDVGKKGCLAVKVDGLWDSAVKGNKMRFFVMDGTDPESFLSFYSKSDLHAARGLQSERLGTLTAWDMRDGYWNYPKKKIFVKRTDVKKKKDCILEGFTAEFYDAMLLCIWEMCVQAATEQLKHQRRRERGRRRQSLALGLTGGSADRRRSQTPVGDTRRVSASLLTYKNVPRGGTGGGGRGGPQPKKASAAAREERAVAQHREVMRQLIREGRMLLARPICSRKGSAPRRNGGRAGVGLRARCDRRKPVQAMPQPPAEDHQADAGEQVAFGRTAGHAAAREEEEEAARTVPSTAGSRVSDAADGKTAECWAAGGGGAAGVAWRAAAPEAGRSAATTAVGVVSKGWPAGVASATTCEAEYEEGGERGRGGGRDEYLRLPAGERVVEDGRRLSEAQNEQDGSRGGVLEATGRTGAAVAEAGCRRGKDDADPRFADKQQHADSDFVEESEASAAATKTGREGGGSTRGAAGDTGQRRGDAETSVGSRGGDWQAVSLPARRQANREEADLVERQEETEAAGTKEKAAAPFFAAGTAQRGGQTGSGQMGGTRATTAAERHTRARRSGTVEEETNVWHYNSNRSISEAMVGCRKLYRNDSTGADRSVQKSAAAPGGGGGAAAALGRLLPWMRSGGGATTKRKETGAQGKEKGAAGGDEQATVIAAEGGRSAASRGDEEERKTGKNTSRADQLGFSRGAREVMVADGIQWTAPGKSTAEPTGRRAAASPQFSKYEQQNRLPAGGHQRVESPMMSPEFLSPRDTGPTNPMFG